ncbi:hypothetical protein OpiT1DRAFT_01248 [Opitutaceae bacterium TAV1]|nr:hypothetical protein OpiT1DRAFT_01248 [Opitutaceae bacterium TAV1]
MAINIITKTTHSAQEATATLADWMSTVADWSMVGITLISVGIAYGAYHTNRKTLEMHREHNRRSVRPNLTKATHTDLRETGIILEMAIVNTGIGPALIRNMRFFLDGKPFNGTGNFGDLAGELLDQCFPADRWERKILFHGTLGEGTGVPANGKKIIASAFFPLKQPQQTFANHMALKKAVLAEDSRAGYAVTYTSVYEQEEWTLSS